MDVRGRNSTLTGWPRVAVVAALSVAFGMPAVAAAVQDAPAAQAPRPTAEPPPVEVRYDGLALQRSGSFRVDVHAIVPPGCEVRVRGATLARIDEGRRTKSCGWGSEHERWQRPMEGQIGGVEYVGPSASRHFRLGVEFRRLGRVERAAGPEVELGQLPLAADVAPGDDAARDVLAAIVANDLDALERSLASLDDADLRLPEGLSPLHWAAALDRAEAVRLLLAAGAPADPLDPSVPSALTFAARRNACEAALVLVEGGADWSRVSGGDGPLRAAAAAGDICDDAWLHHWLLSKAEDERIAASNRREAARAAREAVPR